MLAYISALLLLGLALLAVVLQKTYYFFPVKELKRQARAGDKLAGVLFRAVAYRLCGAPKSLKSLNVYL